LYEAVRHLVASKPSRSRPYVWDDADQALDQHIAALTEDIRTAHGHIQRAIEPVLSSLLGYYA
jgi:phenylalanine ammonia-lyase